MRGYTNCQSCGMPMKQDEKGGGTNADGSKSPTYCFALLRGAAASTLPNLTAKEMQARVKPQAARLRFPRNSRLDIHA